MDAADTTDNLRAVACIRFVRPWLFRGMWSCEVLNGGYRATCDECDTESLSYTLKGGVVK